MENYLLGCDWGNSSFRLGLYSLTDGHLIEEIQSSDGISGIHRSWQEGHYTTNGITKSKVFHEKLLTQINIIAGKTALRLDNTPILISGMASSSIGIADLPYAGLPFHLDGSQVKSKHYEAQEDFPHPVILISGVRAEQDVMRGEETQLIGIWSLLMDRGSRPREAIVIFPGTHSKHVYIKDGQLIDFKTFMTGEMYQITGHHSILKDSIHMQEEPALSSAGIHAFKMGVKKSGTGALLNSLFTVRTNQLFSQLDKIQNSFYLSGLLIGSELNDLQKKQDCSLFLCSGKKLYGLYKLAIEELALSHRTTFVAADVVDRAAMTGQKIIYEQYVNNKLLNE